MSHKVSSELSRELTLFQITMMGLGMMIGAGVFLGIGNAIGIAGPGGVILTFVLNGLLAIMTACSYAELSSAIPHTGGAYNYTRVGFGRSVSFLAGWMEWYASSVAGSLYSVTFGIYIVRYLELLGVMSHIPVPVFWLEKIVAVSVAILFIYINYRGASETGKIGAFFTLGQTLFLIVIGIIGFVVVLKDPQRLTNFQPFLPNGWSRLLMTMGFTYVAFEGFEVIAQTGDEAIEPRKNLPKAMIYSVCIVTLTYVLVSFASIVSVKVGSEGIDLPPWQWIGQFQERGFGEAVSRLIPAGNLLLTLAIIFASTSALNATVYSATRAMYALGRDNMLPPFFAKISAKRKTPWTALLFTGLLVLVIIVFLPTMDVASSASMMFIMLFFLVNICVIRVRWNMSDELTYGFLMPAFPLFPIVAIICQAILAVWLIHMSLVAWIVAPLWIVSGLLIYHLYSKHHAHASAGEIQIIEEEQAEVQKDFRVMVAIANPENAIQLATNTWNLCKDKNAQMDLLHMVPVPEQMPLSDADQYIWEGKESLAEAMLYLGGSFPVNTTIRYCRNIARGIVTAVKSKKIDLLILGWHGNHRSKLYRMGSTVDPIIEKSPCNVIILKDTKQDPCKKILVPLAGGPNGAFALEIASIYAEKHDGMITAFTVNAQENFNVSEYIEECASKHTISTQRIQLLDKKSSSVTEAILRQSESHDLIVLGYTRQSYLYKFTHESIPDQIARRVKKPVVIVKMPARFESWIKRWI